MEGGNSILPILRKVHPTTFLHQILMIRNGLKLQFPPTGKCRVLAILFSEMLHIRFAPIRLLSLANTTRLARIEKHLPYRQIGKANAFFCAWRKPLRHRLSGSTDRKLATTKVRKSLLNMILQVS